jgi:hypothetical protein
LGFRKRSSKALQYTGRLFISTLYAACPSRGVLGCANATLFDVPHDSGHKATTHSLPCSVKGHKTRWRSKSVIRGRRDVLYVRQLSYRHMRFSPVSLLLGVPVPGGSNALAVATLAHPAMQCGVPSPKAIHMHQSTSKLSRKPERRRRRPAGLRFRDNATPTSPSRVTRVGHGQYNCSTRARQV